MAVLREAIAEGEWRDMSNAPRTMASPDPARPAHRAAAPPVAPPHSALRLADEGHLLAVAAVPPSAGRAGGLCRRRIQRAGAGHIGTPSPPAAPGCPRPGHSPPAGDDGPAPTIAYSPMAFPARSTAPRRATPPAYEGRHEPAPIRSAPAPGQPRRAGVQVVHEKTCGPTNMLSSRVTPSQIMLPFLMVTNIADERRPRQSSGRRCCRAPMHAASRGHRPRCACPGRCRRSRRVRSGVGSRLLAWAAPSCC